MEKRKKPGGTLPPGLEIRQIKLSRPKGHFAADARRGHQLQQLVSQQGAGQQTVTGTCLHTVRGTQRVTV
jgi:hypothetical protein